MFGPGQGQIKIQIKSKVAVQIIASQLKVIVTTMRKKKKVKVQNINRNFQSEMLHLVKESKKCQSRKPSSCPLKPTTAVLVKTLFICLINSIQTKMVQLPNTTTVRISKC